MTYQEIIQKPGRKIKKDVYYFNNNTRVTIARNNFVKARLFFNAKLLGTVMKGLELELKEQLPDTAINLSVTAMYNTSMDVKIYGPYYLKETPTYNADSKTYTHKLYDEFVKAMIPYSPVTITYPCTLYAYFCKLLETLNLNTNIESLPNGDRILESDIYDGIGFTFRDVLDDIGQATASLFEIENNIVKKINISNNSNVAIITDDILKNQNIDFGVKIGPINTIVLSRSADADSVFLSDETMILTDGRKEIKISDNQLMNDNNRSDYLPAILNALKGLEYYLFDTELTGYGGFIPLQPVQFQTSNQVYNSYIFNNEIELEDGYKEVIYDELPSETQTDYMASSDTDKKIDQAYIILNKQTKQLKTILSEQTAQGSQISQLNMDVSSIVFDVSDLQNSVDENGQAIENLENTMREEITSTEAKFTAINQTIEDGVPKVTTGLVTIDINGLTVSVNYSKVSTIMKNNTFAVQDSSGKYLAYIGYDEEEHRSKAEMDNLNVNTYFVAGYHRTEKIIRNNEKRTAVFYVGGDN